MRRLSSLLGLWLLALGLVAAESSPQSVFQLRLVLPGPAADAELMKMNAKSPSAQGITSRLYVSKPPLMDHTEVLSAAMDKYSPPGEFRVNITFTAQGRKHFGQITRDNIGKQLAIVVDGQIRSAPAIRTEIPTGGLVIVGGFTEQEATDFISKINEAIGKKR